MSRQGRAPSSAAWFLAAAWAIKVISLITTFATLCAARLRAWRTPRRMVYDLRKGLARHTCVDVEGPASAHLYERVYMHPATPRHPRTVTKRLVRGQPDHLLVSDDAFAEMLRLKPNSRLRSRGSALMAQLRFGETYADYVDITDVFNEYSASFDSEPAGGGGITACQFATMLAIRNVLTWKQVAMMGLNCSQGGTLLRVLTSDLDEREFEWHCVITNPSS